VSQVAFHFGAPDKLDYVGRLLRKAVGRGARLVVHGQAELVRHLDTQLWAVSPTDFISHGVSGDALATRSSVVLTSELHAGLPADAVLVNLAHDVPVGYEAFARVIEVVGLDEEDRALARARWRQYAQQGQTIEKHDLKNQGGGQ
jgi:DNA polymerase III subunit chi